MNKKAFISTVVLVLGIGAWLAVMIEIFMIAGLTRNNILIFIISMLLFILGGIAGFMIYNKIKDHVEYFSEIDFEFHEFEGRVVIKFDKPSEYIILDPDQVLEFGRVLTKRGKKLVNRQSKENAKVIKGRWKDRFNN